MPHDLDFWKDVYRDTLKELVRGEGFDALMGATRTAHLCAQIATESDRLLARALAEPAHEPCPACNDLRFVWPDPAHPEGTGTPCPLCNQRTPTDPVPGNGNAVADVVAPPPPRPLSFGAE